MFPKQTSGTPSGAYRPIDSSPITPNTSQSDLRATPTPGSPPKSAPAASRGHKPRATTATKPALATPSKNSAQDPLQENRYVPPFPHSKPRKPPTGLTKQPKLPAAPISAPAAASRGLEPRATAATKPAPAPLQKTAFPTHGKKAVTSLPSLIPNRENRPRASRNSRNGYVLRVLQKQKWVMLDLSDSLSGEKKEEEDDPKAG